MIYIFVGNDNKSKNIKTKALSKNCDVVTLSGNNLSKEIILDYAGTQSLFGGQSVVVLENLINGSDLIFSKDELESIKNSKTLFVWLEDKLLASDVKKYSKYASIENFDKKVNKAPFLNSFAIADAFAIKDKMKTWVAYNEAINKGVTPESIAGILFWKIKMMMQSGSKVFTASELKSSSSSIVSLYHKAHNGEMDMIIGLEQFILSVLSK